VDRSKSFYTEQLGFGLDVDTSPGEGIRVVQVTPPGSACSIGFGEGITEAAPGSFQGPHLVVSDIVAARDELSQRDVDVSDIRHLENGQWASGPDSGCTDYSSFADFRDPDGNLWVLQEARRSQPEV
jgi:catechol 2,3-dioxygenase-like lactoylglutathione lyase family enzyme